MKSENAFTKAHLEYWPVNLKNLNKVTIIDVSHFYVKEEINNPLKILNFNVYKTKTVYTHRLKLYLTEINE